MADEYTTFDPPSRNGASSPTAATTPAAAPRRLRNPSFPNFDPHSRQRRRGERYQTLRVCLVINERFPGVL
eukprot:TRINITY_DN17522_c0_g1_i1.p1 TRINITY_DN17522_c0_g1~~TRINITY_DN17522_c0_g1_i1.p1  ORF type:complete len:71 (+),score=11.87 TRINITY_DN17522_c0_g1_i1:153-365(+)